MPVRTIFQHPLTRRFISREQAEELGEAIQLTIGDTGTVQELVSFFQDEESEPDIDPYRMEPSRWGGRFIDEGDLDLDRLRATDFPSDADAFRITYSGVNRYRQGKNTDGHMSSSWYGPDMWPPDESWLDDNGAEGIANIVFRRGT